MAEPLLPERHPNHELFICDFGDVIPKSDIASMEHPLFTLSTKPDTTIRKYEHNGVSVTITPSVLGLATIHDKDVLIYCISQLMAGINRGEAPSRKIRLKAYDLLVSTNRQTNGQGYELLKKSFKRLQGTIIETNIVTGDVEDWSTFGILENARIVREMNGRMIEMEVVLPEWLYNSILKQSVLTISRDYFRLRKPLERRIYEISRKHCGTKQEWKIGIDKLHNKSGSGGSIYEFRRMLKKIQDHDHLPDYRIEIHKENVIFMSKSNSVTPKVDSDRPFLRPDTIENAKKILSPSRLDVYAIEADWVQMWNDSGKPELKSPDGAFINFCKKRIGSL